jgi:hypothetical protein
MMFAAFSVGCGHHLSGPLSSSECKQAKEFYVVPSPFITFMTFAICGRKKLIESESKRKRQKNRYGFLLFI